MRHDREETKIEAELVLRAYQQIVKAGERTPTGFNLGALEAIEDYDGYGVTVTDGTAAARVLFHNRVALDVPSSRALQRFRLKLKEVAG